ncbi:MAG: hypothetical protein VX876_07940 [Planctomycetota bacterium]|nr:hypothetical protein [Planctomycetota bacterium]
MNYAFNLPIMRAEAKGASSEGLDKRSALLRWLFDFHDINHGDPVGLNIE